MFSQSKYYNILHSNQGLRQKIGNIIECSNKKFSRNNSIEGVKKKFTFRNSIECDKKKFSRNNSIEGAKKIYLQEFHGMWQKEIQP